MSTTSFLYAIKRRPSVIAPIIAQAWTLFLLFSDRPFAAAIVACIGIAALAVLLAIADDRANAIRDTAAARVAELEAELAEANTDPVTGLPSRRLAERHIADALGVQLTVAVADVDDMHAINNGHDHQFGDDYLAQVAERLYGLAGEGDMVARLGGDEFVVVTTRPPLALAHAITAAMREPITVQGADVPVRLSVGICRLPGGDAHVGLGRADLAMYAAKRRRSGVEHYDPARDGVPQPPGVRPAVRHRDRDRDRDRDRRSLTNPMPDLRRRSPTRSHFEGGVCRGR